MVSLNNCNQLGHNFLNWIMASERRQIKAGITLALVGTLLLASVLL